MEIFDLGSSDKLNVWQTQKCHKAVKYTDLLCAYTGQKAPQLWNECLSRCKIFTRPLHYRSGQATLIAVANFGPNFSFLWMSCYPLVEMCIYYLSSHIYFLILKINYWTPDYLCRYFTVWHSYRLKLPG